MGRMKELAEQVAELKRCGEILIDISENMTQMFSAADVKNPVKEEPKEPVAPKEEKKVYSFEEVRAVLVAKSRDGHTDEVKDSDFFIWCRKTSLTLILQSMRNSYRRWR